MDSKPSALTIQPGAPAPEPPRDLIEKAAQRRRRRLSREQYVAGVLGGDRAVLAQAITLMESALPQDAELAQDILEACLPATGASVRVGITGSPGVGKSTVIEALGSYLTRERGEKVAVLAIDPSSQISGGSILGDKTRMETLAADDRAFVRPSPSGGSLGGVARRTREAMLLCEAAGYRTVIVETIGVGQSETAVRDMVDFFLLLVMPGAGDELQGMKRGIIEMTDLIAVNKADGANRERAEQARREYERVLRLFAVPRSGWMPRVATCSGLTREGIATLWETVLEHRAFMTASGWFERNRREQVKSWMNEMIEWGLREQFRANPVVADRLPEYERDVIEGRISPFRAAQRLLELFRENK